MLVKDLKKILENLDPNIFIRIYFDDVYAINKVVLHKNATLILDCCPFTDENFFQSPILYKE